MPEGMPDEEKSILARTHAGLLTPSESARELEKVWNHDRCPACSQTFQKYDDPGHGWLKVPLTLLDELGIRDRISTSSFQRGGFAYLEEDVDASLFIETVEKRCGSEPKVKVHIADRTSAVTRYAPYHTTPATAFKVGETYYDRSISNAPGNPVRVVGYHTDKHGETWVLGVLLANSPDQPQSYVGRTFIFSPGRLATTPLGDSESDRNWKRYQAEHGR